MLQIVEKDCTFTPDRARAVIVIESTCEGPPFTDAFYELDTQAARQLAQGYAAQMGVAPAYINGNVEGPYPVNSDGLSLEFVKDSKGNSLPQSHPKMQPKAYRISVPVCRPLR